MYSDNLSRRLGCFDLMILTFDLFGSKVLFTWEIYILRCSLICKGTFGSKAFGNNKIFCKTLRSFVEYLVWRLENIYLSSILADLCFANIFCRWWYHWWRRRFDGGVIATTLHISSSNCLRFQGVSTLYLVIILMLVVSFFIDSHLLFTNWFSSTDLFCRRRVIWSLGG